MKKKFLRLVGCMILLPVLAMAQEEIPKPDITELVLNSSPAYFLLGVQPENIQRPSTPRELIGGVQTALVNGSLQPNFAMEFNPFTWGKKNRPNQFYVNDYFYKKEEAIKKNFAISLASSTSDTVVFGDLKKGTGLGYGLRITILPGKVNEETLAQFTQWEFLHAKTLWLTVLSTKDANDQFQDITNVSKSDALFILIENSLRKNGAIRPDRVDAIMMELKKYSREFLTVKADEVKTKVADELKKERTEKTLTIDKINAAPIPFEREGFILEFAAAGVTVLQENEWKQVHHGKTAFWLTPSYKFKKKTKENAEDIQSTDLMGIFRYVLNDRAVDTANYFDTGIKLQYNKNLWNAAFEFCGRHASVVPVAVKSKWTYSWIATFSYTINETATLKFSFGSNFDGNTRTYTDPNKVIALGGLNLGLFKPKPKNDN